MGEGAKADLYCYDMHTNTWSTPAPAVEGPMPPSRSFHTACACGDLMFIFGGCGEGGRLNDLWKFDTKVKVLS